MDALSWLLSTELEESAESGGQKFISNQIIE